MAGGRPAAHDTGYAFYKPQWMARFLFTHVSVSAWPLPIRKELKMLRSNRNRRPRVAKKNSASATKRRRLGFQGLEQRRLLASDIGLSDGFICITGTELNDAVDVYSDGDQIVVSAAEYGLDGEMIDSTLQSFHQDEVRGIYFQGNAGDDVFVNDTSLNAIAQGGSGNDVLISGLNRDVLHGSSGDDVLIGSQDIMMAGAGDNAILSNSMGQMQIAEETAEETDDIPVAADAVAEQDEGSSEDDVAVTDDATASEDTSAEDDVIAEEEAVVEEDTDVQEETVTVDDSVAEDDAVATDETAAVEDTAVADDAVAVDDSEPVAEDESAEVDDTTGQSDESLQDDTVIEDVVTVAEDSAPAEDAIVDGEESAADDNMSGEEDVVAEDVVTEDVVTDDATASIDEGVAETDPVAEEEAELVGDVEDLDAEDDADMPGSIAATFTFTVGAHHPRWFRNMDGGFARDSGTTGVGDRVRRSTKRPPRKTFPWRRRRPRRR